MHPLLRRQLGKLGLLEAAPDPDQWQQFLVRVERAYTEAEEDRYLLERSLTLSSTEMQERAMELARVNGELARAQEHLRTVVANAPIILFALDADGTITVSEGQALAALGAQSGELVGRSVRDLYGRFPDLDQYIDRAMAGEAFEATVQVGEAAFDIRLVGQRDAEGRHCGTIGVALDVTARKRAEDQLSHQAFHDPLTGLPNRALLMQRLDRMLAASQLRGTAMAVLFIDLDRFKVINDSLGHQVGDELLLTAGRRLGGCLREEDLIARLGGDEFTVVLPHVATPVDAVDVAERIVEAFQQPFHIEGRELFVTASVGVACSSPQHRAAADLLRDADVALYEGKGAGRSRAVLFDAHMTARAMERLDLESALRGAIERGELRVVYQPEVELETGAVVGAEALVRWQHPERGLVSPVDFIPLAEETGLILPIGAWVLREACRQGRIWQDVAASVAPIAVAVNLSARQLQEPGLVALVAQTLAETGFDPSLLRLEITESMVMEDVQRSIGTLLELRALGAQLAIDDFGTGYSSLSYLARFPVDTLKIDRSLVADLDSNLGTTAIVEATVTLAHALGMDVTAEGIEKEEQLTHLRRLACDRAQGYYFSRPVPPAVIDGMLGRSLPMSQSAAA